MNINYKFCSKIKNVNEPTLNSNSKYIHTKRYYLIYLILWCLIKKSQIFYIQHYLSCLTLGRFGFEMFWLRSENTIPFKWVNKKFSSFCKISIKSFCKRQVLSILSRTERITYFKTVVIWKIQLLALLAIKTHLS
jgi:hypothetical protein